MGERAKIIFDWSFSELAMEFNARRTPTRVAIPKKLHDDFIELYRRSADLAEKISLVMDDGEHRLAVEEWRHDFRLPGEDCLDGSIGALRAALKACNPYHTEGARAGKVSITPAQVESFFNVFSKSYDLVRDVFDMFRETDYIRFLRHLRDVDHVPYAGPSSLKEVVQTYFCLVRACRNQKDYFHELRDMYDAALEKKVGSAMQGGGALKEFLQVISPVKHSVPAPR